jgi:hypothetical protein
MLAEAIKAILSSLQSPCSVVWELRPFVLWEGGTGGTPGGKAAVRVVLSHHPNSEQDAQVQQVELVAGSRRVFLLTESTRVTSTGAKMVSIFGNGANRVLELDWANGLV